MTMTEIWKPVPQFEGVYSVSNLGRVKSVDRITADGRFVKGKHIKPVKRPDGYLQISRYKGNGKMRIELIHRLVAKAFLGEPPKGYVVDHIDRNRANNNIENLRYIPKPENDSQGGKAQGKAVRQYNLQGELITVYPSIAEANRQTNVQGSDIIRNCQGKRRTAGGFKWEYA